MYLRPLADFQLCVDETAARRKRQPWLMALCASRNSSELHMIVREYAFEMPKEKVMAIEDTLSEAQAQILWNVMHAVSSESFSCMSSGLTSINAVDYHLEMHGVFDDELTVIKQAALDAKLLEETCATNVLQIADFADNFGSREAKRLREIASAANENMQTMFWFMEHYVDYCWLFIKKQHSASGR